MSQSPNKRPRLDYGLPAENDMLGAAVEGLEAVQHELAKVNEECSDALLAIERQFNKTRRPIYEKRAEHIRRIPNFWITAFENCRVLDDLITDQDADALQYLEDVNVEDFEDIKSGYRLTFRFRRDNPYFAEEELVKEYHFGEDSRLVITATPIIWKPGKELAQPGDAALAPGEPGFFAWFLGAGEFVDYPGLRDDVACAIKDDVWPDALRYYNNEAEPELEDGEEYEEYGDDLEVEEGDAAEGLIEEGGEQYEEEDEQGEEGDEQYEGQGEGDEAYEEEDAQYEEGDEQFEEGDAGDWAEGGDAAAAGQGAGAENEVIDLASCDDE